MSGICGVVHRNRPAEALKPVLAALLDDLGDFGAQASLWAATGVALAHRQEQIFRRDRLETGAVHSTNMTLCADVRLLHADALRATLGSTARALAETPDSALVLAACQRWGENAPKHLEGEFAFAVWEAAPRRLTLARDHLGLRPLYYATWADGLAFSSSLTGLLALPEVDTSLDEFAIADYLATLATEDESTPYRGIRRLPPGSVLRWTPDGVRPPRRYWHIDTAPRTPFPHAGDYVEAVRERVNQVIAQCCDTDHGVGLVLSGGLDSSTLAGLAAGHLAAQGRSLLTASSVLPSGHTGPAQDERPYMEAICAQYPNIEPHWVTATDRNLLAGSRDDLRRRGQPSWNPFNVMDDALQETLAGAGARVVLDGLHGDSVWSFENPVFPVDFLLRGQPLKAWREWTALSRTYRVGRRTLARLMLTPYGALLPSWETGARARLTAHTGPSAVSLGLAARTSLLARARRSRARGLPFLSLRAAQRVDLANAVWPRLREEAARTGAAKGIALRSPLWDPRVLELCLSAPPEVLHSGGYGRALARAIGEGVVPDLVRKRTDKGAFLPDFHARVLRERDAFLRCIDTAEADSLASNYVDFSTLRTALAELSGEQSVRRWSLGAQAVVMRGQRMAEFLHDYEFKLTDPVSASMADIPSLAC